MVSCARGVWAATFLRADRWGRSPARMVCVQAVRNWVISCDSWPGLVLSALHR